MYLITKVIIPNKLDRTQKSLFKELDETNLKKKRNLKILINIFKQLNAVFI